MIGALWQRWFDAREYRRALGVAERNYRQALIRVAKLMSENLAATGRADALDLQLAATETALDDAKKRVKALEGQLDELAAAKVVEHRIVDLHADVSKLPPAPNRDRENCNRLAAENARLRALLDKEGHPS